MQPRGGANQLLSRVREGMTVYDRDNREVGTVKSVSMGGGNDPAEVRRQSRDAGNEPGGVEETFTGNLFDAFTPTDGVPDELRLKLEREGYVEIDSAGLLAADRYATPDQIAEVTSDGVILSTSRDQLPKE